MAIIGNGCISWRAELPAQFISKEKSGAHASGFAIFERVGSNLIKVNDGIEQPLQGVLAKLSTGNTELLLQERLFDHAYLQAVVCKKTLQTIRITTYRETNKSYRLLFWWLKLVIGNNISDNFSDGRTGNLVAFGSNNSGQLLGARTLVEGEVGLTTIHNHPETGKPFKQIEVPLWREAIETTLHAHQYFPDCKALGWDVALTSGGPIILEANAWWDPPNYAPELMSTKDWHLFFR